MSAPHAPHATEAGRLAVEASNALQQADGVKKFTKANYKQAERAAGLLPKNKQSPFGDFPANSQPRKDPSALSTRTVVPTLHGAKGTKAGAPPKACSTAKRPIAPTEFRRRYDRGDLPVLIQHGAKNRLQWKEPLEKLDYHLYLPVLVDGLREKDDPYRFVAVQGVLDMIEAGGERVVPVIPQLIIPLKEALSTRDCEIIGLVLRVIQSIIASHRDAGQHLVPYYRQLLPVFNLFRNKTQSTGDAMDFAQGRGSNSENIGALIDETLEVMERSGGSDAFVNIKYMIPTYQSCLVPSAHN